jgi:hypothetical protein
MPDAQGKLMPWEAKSTSPNMSGSGVLDPRLAGMGVLDAAHVLGTGQTSGISTSVDKNPDIAGAQADLKNYMGQLYQNTDKSAIDTMNRVRDQAEGLTKTTMGNIARTGAGINTGAALLSLGKVQDQQARAMQEANTTMGNAGREQYGGLLAQQAGLAGAAAGNQVSMTGMQNQLLQTQMQQQQAQAQLAMQQQQLEMEKERLKQQTEMEKMRLAQNAAIAGIGSTTGTQPTVAKGLGGGFRELGWGGSSGI